jgi:hypothetical protein
MDFITHVNIEDITMTNEVIVNENRYLNGRVSGRRRLLKDRKSTPGYYDLVRKGLPLPNNPYSMESLDSNSTTFELLKVYPWSTTSLGTKSVHEYLGGVHTAPLAYESMLEEASLKAQQSFYNNADAYDSTLGVTLAELPKAIHLVGDSATRIARTFKRLKRFDIPGAFEALGLAKVENLRHSNALIKSARNSKRSVVGRTDFAANAWLEMTYGWKPLLSEIDNAAHDLAFGWEAHDADFRIHGSGRVKSTAHFVNGSRLAPGNNGPGGAIDYHRQESSVRVGYTSHVKVTDPTWRALSSLGLANPLEIAWELLPYSFVVDWFVPFGDWIASLDAMAGLTMVDASKSVKTKSTLTATLHPGCLSYPYDIDTSCYYDGSTSAFERTVESSLPGTNFLRFESPSEAMGVNRSISAIALLQNAFKR